MNPKPRTLLLCTSGPRDIASAAPVFRALQGSALRPIVLHTGPADEAGHPLYAFFGMEPVLAIDLLLGGRTTTASAEARPLGAFEEMLTAVEPVAVLVFGSTPAALAAALTASHAEVPVGHVQGGDTYPTAAPEASHRTLVAGLARWHFAASQQAAEALAGQHHPAEHVHLVGNTTDAAAQQGAARLDPRGGPPERGLPTALRDWSAGGRLVIVSVGGSGGGSRATEQTAAALGALAARRGDLRVLWPLAPDRAARAAVARGLRAHETAGRVRLCGPLSLTQRWAALRDAWLVVTDAEEIRAGAEALGCPVVAAHPDLATRLEDLLADLEAGTGLAAAEAEVGVGAGEQIARVLLREAAHHRGFIESEAREHRAGSHAVRMQLLSRPSA